MAKKKMKVIFNSSKDELPKHNGWIRIMKIFKAFDTEKIKKFWR